MFCTHCKTGFSWNTGKVIKDSENSNPYLLLFIQGNGQTQGIRGGNDNRCFSITGANWWIYMDMRNTAVYKEYNAIYKKWFSFVSEIVHIENVCQNNYHLQVVNQRDVQYMYYNRIRLAMNELEPSTFQTSLMKDYKQNSYNQQFVQLNQMLRTSCRDWLESLKSTSNNDSIPISVSEKISYENYFKQEPLNKLSGGGLFTFRNYIDRLNSIDFYKNFNWELVIDFIDFYNRESFKLTVFYNYTHFKFWCKLPRDLPKQKFQQRQKEFAMLPPSNIDKEKHPVHTWAFTYETLRLDSTTLVRDACRAIFCDQQDFLKEYIEPFFSHKRIKDNNNELKDLDEIDEDVPRSRRRRRVL